MSDSGHCRITSKVGKGLLPKGVQSEKNELEIQKHTFGEF